MNSCDVYNRFDGIVNPLVTLRCGFEKMGVEKQGSKGGRYVGSFLQLFDWNAKSRKKLFSSKTDLPEPTKQGKRSEDNLPITRFRLVDEAEIGTTSSIKGSSDYSCASSVTDDDGYGIRAPGVVARLMGLDSLPTSNAVEPYSTPFFDTHSLRDAPFRRKDPEFYHEHHNITHSGHLPDKVEHPLRKHVGPKPQKFSRPIEKFQTEILPPKSAKSIPITHHKLLSPIKSPAFVPSQDVAHIMEAAAKIIEPGPQTTTRAKISSAGSSSVPLKVQELREKLEATQRPPRTAEASQRLVDSNAAKQLKGQSLNKSWNGSVDTTSFRISSNADDSSASVKIKGKSISLAIQAKVNVQRREGLNSSRELEGLNKQDELKSTESFKSQPQVHKITQRKSSAHSTSLVLRQNNQKQNCSADKDKLSSKSLVSDLNARKVVPGSSSLGRQRSLSKAGASRNGSRRSSLEAREGGKDVPSSAVKNVPRKKRSIDGNLHFGENQVGDNILISKSAKPGQSTSVVDRQITLVEESRKKAMDVVSFTFTAPLTRTMPGLDASRQVDDRNQKALLNPETPKLPSLGYNAIGADALSILLEQKLRELTNGMKMSRGNNFIPAAASAVQQNVFSAGVGNTMQTLCNGKVQQGLNVDNIRSQIYSAFSTAELDEPRRKYKFQGREEVEEYNSHVKISQSDNCHVPSPVSILEPSLLTESCNSSDSAGSNCTQESKQCSSVQGQELLRLNSLTGFHQVETETDLSDSASSTSNGNVSAKGVFILKETDSLRSTEWEQNYVKEILCNVELMFKDYASGRTREIINPHLFDQLERRKAFLQASGEEFKLGRKVIFDCVSECLELRCQRFVGGGCKMWAKGVEMVKRKDRLAQEVYREIQRWRSMGNSMVNELVDSDMSSQYGRWLDFQVDEFALGMEIENEIFDSLVVEVVADNFAF
ncbi:hypothetical protein Ancab_013017 [Ancistrocladus abbreviatus]